MEPTPRGSRRRIIFWPLLVAALVIAYQYFTAETFQNPETGTISRVALSPEQEQALGLQSFQQILAESDVVKSGPEHDMVVEVANRLVREINPASGHFDWQVSLVRNDQANAFCLPGGKIVVYTGILPITRTPAGLAAVMGHEIAHATSRHGAQRLFQQQAVQTALMGAQGSVADLDVGQQRMVLGAIGAGAQYGVLMPFSRDHESEADEIGLRYMARAGYDPREAIAFWERMQEAGGGQPPEWMSTHPSHGTRIERLRELMPQALQEYQESAGRR
jgi:metalloendopeptidase OMA1, mitochondrial